jgi:hypothetical protein
MPHDPIWWTAVVRDVVVFAAAATSAIILWLRKRSSRHWPIIFGKVESASSFENNGAWLTDLSCSYSVQGDFYSGQFRVRSGSEGKASEHELRWKQRSITVRYSPRNRQISIVRTEEQDGLRG